MSTKSPSKHHQKIPCFRYNTTYEVPYLRLAIVYENFIFTPKYAFAERCCFLGFSFEGKLKQYDIWNGNIRKLTKICSSLPFSLIFIRRKIIFSSSVDEKVGMEFTSCSPYQGHNLRWKLLNLWNDYSRGENNESSVCKTNQT